MKRYLKSIYVTQLLSLLEESEDSNDLSHKQHKTLTSETHGSSFSGISLTSAGNPVLVTRHVPHVRTVRGRLPNSQRRDRKSLKKVETANTFMKNNDQDPKVHTL